MHSLCLRSELINAIFSPKKQTQWNVNEGKCGLCGDSYSDTRPREHENGGTYGQGVIVDTYKAGQTIPVDVLITANHKGYFLYDLCNLDASSESDECFAVHKLKLANGQDRYTVPNGLSDVFFNTTLVLPTNLDCKQCVLRWTYVTGESSLILGSLGDSFTQLLIPNRHFFAPIDSQEIHGVIARMELVQLDVVHKKIFVDARTFAL